MPALEEKIAVLHQGAPAPAVGGVKKPLKPGGYQDSGADIAFALQATGLPIATPSSNPDPAVDAGWSFPDTSEGIRAALDAGATSLWANTTLYSTHPLIQLREELASRSISFVGQDPRDVERFEDKAFCNDWLVKQPGLQECFPKAWRLATSNGVSTELKGIPLPAVVKPIRGEVRSHGVSVVKTLEDFEARLGEFASEGEEFVLVESFCSGEEITVTVMPPGDYELVGKKTSHWALPIVTRFGHADGVAPYNGVVAVTANSRAITQAEFDGDKNYQVVAEQCELVGKLCGSFAPIRIDARRVSETDKRFLLFDVNMKPNATGPGRPGRDQQASLTLIAANQLGWDYPSLLRNILRAAKPFKALRR
ncbi:hypothetical protein BCR35DRAFT_341228 [Leucosporidium creatinivorum]|uniref:ATP-grasp domain-containing protein n=1 Tax=Leucosporidium creatinivorum TaxID=106004 RepID=A0A1Y2FD11_9BASI|nr:hypothetical protein BCR35DRAFT_341228 [Leucosporidium creatinivorum]